MSRSTMNRPKNKLYSDLQVSFNPISRQSSLHLTEISSITLSLRPDVQPIQLISLLSWVLPTKGTNIMEVTFHI